MEEYIKFKASNMSIKKGDALKIIDLIKKRKSVKICNKKTVIKIHHKYDGIFMLWMECDTCFVGSSITSKDVNIFQGSQSEQLTIGDIRFFTRNA